MDAATIEFTCTASRALSKAARNLAETSKNGVESPKLIDLATRLFSIAEELDQPQPGQRPKSAKEILNYLKDLENLCTWPPKVHSVRASRQCVPETDFPKLFALSRNRLNLTTLTYPLKHLARNDIPRRALFKNLDRLLPRRQQASDKTTPRQLPEEHSLDLYAALHDVLEQCAECRCSAAAILHRKQRLHRGNLKLTRNTLIEDDEIAVDAVYQASDSHQKESLSQWTSVRFRISKPTKPTTRPRFAEFDTTIANGTIKATVKSNQLTMKPEDFCKLLLLRRGAGRHQLRVVDNNLYDLQDVIQAEQMLLPQPHISLADALRSYALSDDAKILLAYSVARSVWQFYDTKIMSNRWTAELIYFMVEAPGWSRRTEQQGFISPVHPFVQMALGDTSRSQLATEQEFVPKLGSVHWAPRILALGIVLASIFSDDHLAIGDDGESDWQARFNNELLYCQGAVEDPSWPLLEIKTNVVRRRIKEAVSTCLRGDLFKNLDAEVSERKSLLWKHVVSPLESVTKLVRIEDKRAAWQRKDLNTPRIGQSEPPTGVALSHSPSASSQEWLCRLATCSVNRDIRTFYKRPDSKRTRIAILDTGFDINNAFFNRARLNRLKDRWKDFLHESTEPLDEDGHGTHVLSIAMTIAPSADICVGRVAKNDADFANSYEIIAKGIDWAVNEMNADIVSMSFGWPQERESHAVSIAIVNAVVKRKDAVLFYAAASNSGGDHGEFFPAGHEFVTAIRATTHEGKFKDFNAPPDYAGADVIGTLGVNIPSISDDPNTARLLEGTSFATPVAAGISALVLDAAKACRPGVEPNNTLDKMRTRHGMRQILCSSAMSRKMNERAWYLSAIGFCNKPDIDRRTILDYAALNA